jgi:LuxR family maltose regulon positive regulatory protein
VTYARAAGDVDHVSRLVVRGGLTPPPSDPAATGERGWLAWFDDPELLRRYPGVAARGAWVHLLDANAAAAARWQDALGSAAARGRRTPAGDTPAALAAVLRAATCNDGVEQMRADARRAARGLDPAGPWPPVALLLRGVAELLLGDADHAERSLADAAEAAESRALGEIRTLALTELSLVAAAQGDDARAEELVVEARSAAASAGLDDDPRGALAAAVSARLHLRQGETGLARAALERADALSVRLTHVLPWYAMQTCLELGRAELAFVDAEGARALLDRAAAIARRRPGLGRLEAELETLQGEVNALAAHAGRPAGLTAAELRLLPLLTTHLSFREIAEQLYVSRNTVKTQAISVYRKLDASSRSEAIARARELGLVDAPSQRAEFTLSG